jgi:phosphoglucosamine mutase
LKRKYFGTDGIRGEANKDLSVDIVTSLGFALGYYLKKNNPKKKSIRVVLGTDTRISGYMIRSALFAGLNALGVDVDFVGVLPTPGVAYLTRKLNADAGIMISASHNPAKDNGIKIFASNGYKLPDEVELELEKLMDNVEMVKKEVVPGDQLGKFKYREDEFYYYSEFLLSTVDVDFKGMKIVLDVANGAAYRIAQRVFNELGAELVVINNNPNGTNINVKCGSTDMSILQKVVQGYEAAFGLAFDGDADRLLAVDSNGNEIDGDKIIAVIGESMKEENRLNNNQIVTTVMSNMGFESYLDEKGINLIRANVGDRYVLEKMKKHGLNLGGEQSGHIILLDYNTTGDGLLTALQLVQAVKKSGKSIEELVSNIAQWPQRLVNIRVSKEKKDTWKDNETIVELIRIKEEEMSGSGRVLVRTSGTEPLVRVMVEGKDLATVNKVAEEIALVVEKELS